MMRSAYTLISQLGQSLHFPSFCVSCCALLLAALRWVGGALWAGLCLRWTAHFAAVNSQRVDREINRSVDLSPPACFLLLLLYTYVMVCFFFFFFSARCFRLGFTVWICVTCTGGKKKKKAKLSSWSLSAIVSLFPDCVGAVMMNSSR